MKAGQALGLLAGMGALSALGRGTDLQGNRFTGLLDMIDGGGGGKSGDRFQGGGLLSMLGNLFAKPYEAQQRVEDIAGRTSARNVTPNTTTPPVLNQIVPSYGAQESIAQTENAMTRPYNQSYNVEGYNVPAAAVDPRNFDPSTEPSTLTEAQKEALVMGQQVVPINPATPTSRGGQRGGLLDYSGPTSRGGRRGERPLLYSGRSDYDMPDVGPTYSGRGISVGGFSPTLYASMVDDLIASGMGDFVDTADQETMMDLYSTYVQNGGKLYNG